MLLLMEMDVGGSMAWFGIDQGCIKWQCYQRQLRCVDCLMLCQSDVSECRICRPRSEAMIPGRSGQHMV